MLARLGDRLNLLSGGGRDRPERQQTLRGAIDWSYELLTDDERALFRRLSVFVRGARLDGIDKVCPGDEVHVDLLDGLTSLVEKSLLRQVPAGDGEPRFVMLGTIREYALDRLAESGRANELNRRHAEHFADLASQAVPFLLGDEKRKWLDWLEGMDPLNVQELEWALAGEQVLVPELEQEAARIRERVAVDPAGVTRREPGGRVSRAGGTGRRRAHPGCPADGRRYSHRYGIDDRRSPLDGACLGQDPRISSSHV